MVYGLSKLHAKQFYQVMKEKNSNETSICFDIQQNQPLPKLSISEVFYLRHVWKLRACGLVFSNFSDHLGLEPRSSVSLLHCIIIV